MAALAAIAIAQPVHVASARNCSLTRGTTDESLMLHVCKNIVEAPMLNSSTWTRGEKVACGSVHVDEFYSSMNCRFHFSLAGQSGLAVT